LRVALAGLGGAAIRGHLPAIRLLERERKLTLVAAADPNASQRSAVASALPGLPIFDTAEKMLHCVPSEILIIAAEPSSHAQLALLGADNEQHVLCEKPLILTREQHEALAATFQDRPHLGLVAVHQYRYSPTWVSMSRWARCASRLTIPVQVVVEVDRNGTDSHALSSWRTAGETSGGLLADHAVHFLALGWTISEDLEVLTGWRDWDNAHRERATATVRLGSGRLDVRLSSAAAARHTVVNVQMGPVTFTWSDDSAVLRFCTHIVRRWRVDALSNRDHIDALYLPLYNDLIANLKDPSWRRRRRAEALTVGNALIALLENVPTSWAAP
jgi:predicted dehydrogenase